MKKTITAFLIYVLFFSSTAFAQHAIKVERSKMHGTNDPGDNIALSFFISDALNSGTVLRLTYGEAHRYADYRNDDYDSKVLSLDIGKRWNIKSRKWLNVYFETSLSGMALNTKRYYRWDDYNYFQTIPAEILINSVVYPSGTEGPSPQKGVLSYSFNRENYQVAFMPGAMYGGGVDFILKDRFSIGLQFKNSAYYEFYDNDLLFYFSYGLNAGFRF